MCGGGGGRVGGGVRCRVGERCVCGWGFWLEAEGGIGGEGGGLGLRGVVWGVGELALIGGGRGSRWVRGCGWR